MALIDIQGTPYSYDDSSSPDLQRLASRVKDLRTQGRLSPEVLYRIRRYFRIKNIYNSNAIEGNLLELGETRQIVELGLTITGKPLRDQAEARNLSDALDYLEELAADTLTPITEVDIRQLHHFVLKGINEEAGSYRNVNVRISGSDYSPPGPESVASEMAEFADWLTGESTSSDYEFLDVSGLTSAAVAHTWFVMIHPFIDGNGRVARLLMNLLLMRFGYPVSIITKVDRLRYYDALEISQSSDLTPFIVLLSECISESLEEYEVAAAEQQELKDWSQSIAEKFTQGEKVRALNEYEIWRNAMDLMQSHFQQAANFLTEAAQYGGSISTKDYGSLDFEKYAALRQGMSAKRTWFLRVDFRRSDKVVRYLFFFGSAKGEMRDRCIVTLHIAREEPPNSYRYERLEQIIAPNVPVFFEIGYEMSKERFVVRRRNNKPRIFTIEDFTRQFFNDVITKHFSN